MWEQGPASLTPNEGNSTVVEDSANRRQSSTKKIVIPESLEEQVAYYKDQIAQEKAGKRKLFHSLVKIANELRQTREMSVPLVEQQKFQEKSWYEGGLWRAPEVLPAVTRTPSAQQQHRIRMPAISLSDLFFNLVIVTAFTRVGVAVSQQGHLTDASFLYFAVFWTIWSKETSYSTRFDTSDLSAQIETLLTCFAVLFASLSVQSTLQSPDATRVMMAGGGVALLHALLHFRVAWTTWNDQDTVAGHVKAYAMFNMVMNLTESVVWMVGIVFIPEDTPYRWIIFATGVVLALRVPRSFLSNDFHAACSKRSVLFILLLGFLLQSIVVVASEFFAYQTPTFEDYAFVGAACLMFFCIKLLYVDESAGSLAGDHALLVNRWAGFFFNVGNFALLLSTTIMGSGLNLLTHSYLAATAALPGPAKNLVTGGFSAVLFSIFFIKSMHLKRVPLNPRHRALFVGAYLIQTVVLLGVVAMAAIMCYDMTLGGFLAYLMQSDIELLFFLSASALFVVMMSWLDEGVELNLYNSVEDSRSFRVHPFGFWWCLQAEINDEDLEAAEEVEPNRTSMMSFSSRGSLSVLSPLLGSSLADMKREMSGYGSTRGEFMSGFGLSTRQESN